MNRRIIVLSVIALLAAVKDGRAEEKDKVMSRYDLGKVIVSATKTESYQAEVGSSSTVITAADIRKSKKVMIQDVLREVPGLTVAQTGTFGGTTSVFLRGSKPGHTLVMIDGIEVNDPRGAETPVNFAHFTTDNIESIEIIRGPQSVLYGSDAIGGVINIITKKGQGKTKFEASVEGGTHNTIKEYLGLNGESQKVDYSFWLSRLDSSGISKARGGAERDGYSSSTFSSRLGYQLSDTAKLNFILRSTYADFDLDDGAYDDDPNSTSWSQDFISRVELAQAFNSRWEHKLSFNFYNLETRNRDERDAVDKTEDAQSWFKSDSKKIEWQNNFNLSDWDTLTAGLEYEKGRGSSYQRSGATKTKIDRRSRDNLGYYLQNQLTIGERLFITPALRVDDYELFGKKNTYKISSSYIFPETASRLKANLGTGFKSPTIFQLYSSFGDPNLLPDKSLSYDFGVEQAIFDNKVFLGITYFHNKFENMVEFDSVTNKYKNIGRAKAFGWETEFSFNPAEKLKLGMNYTYTATEDEETGKELNRRPRNQASLNINWEFIPKVNLNLGLAYKGHNWNNAANTQKVKPYAKIDLGFTYELSKDFNLFARIENLLDRQYEDVRGFNGLDRSLFAGIKATF